MMAMCDSVLLMYAIKCCPAECELLGGASAARRSRGFDIWVLCSILDMLHLNHTLPVCFLDLLLAHKPMSLHVLNMQNVLLTA